MKYLRLHFDKIALAAIVLLAFLLRFVNLSGFPVGFNADEASFGYDAYSILKTGRDQWGSFLPLTLKSFGDYKSPLYSYLDAPFVKVFGLTKFATRLPNVIVGTLAVLATYFLCLELSKRLKVNRALALSAGFLLAVSPWHIMMSRGAFEANLITFFLPAGIFFFLKGINTPKFLALSALFFGLNLFTYHSAKVITPVILFGLILIFRREIREIKFGKILPGAVVFLLFFIGFIYTFMIGGGIRAMERSIVQGALEEGAKEKISIILKGGNPVLARLLHNKYQVVARRFISNYSQYFSYKYLFTKGAGEATYGMIPGVGVLYFFEGLLILGLIPLAFRKEFRGILTVLILWLLIAPVPAALATGIGFAGNRSEGMIPVLQILGAFGLVGWVMLLKRIDKRLIYAITCALLLLSLYNFAKIYFRVQSSKTAGGMLYGDIEVAEWLKDNSDGKNVIVSRGLSEPQIFIAFANRWDPSEYQKATKEWGFDKLGLVWLDQMPEYKLGNYTIKSIDWKVDVLKKNTLFVGRYEEIPPEVKQSKVFYYPDGSPDISIVNYD